MDADDGLAKHREHLEQRLEPRTAELEQMNLQLEETNVRLQEVDRLKSVFLASMSHELRTPLNSIIGFTGILLMGMSGPLNEEQSKQLTIVKHSANHLLGLVNEVLDIAKIEAGKVDFCLEEFDLAGLVKEVVDSFALAAGNKGLVLSADVPAGISMRSDRRWVKQVLMNLISNAVKGTDRGGVHITSRVSSDNSVRIRVSDSGIGIRDEELGMLFLPFQQVDMSRSRTREGTGLGLYLARRLSVMLGGDIVVQSEFGKGSEFTVVVPMHVKEASET